MKYCLQSELCNLRLQRQMFEYSIIATKLSMIWYLSKLLKVNESKLMDYYDELKFEIGKWKWKNNGIKLWNLVYFCKNSDILYFYFLRIWSFLTQIKIIARNSTNNSEGRSLYFEWKILTTATYKILHKIKLNTA